MSVNRRISLIKLAKRRRCLDCGKRVNVGGFLRCAYHQQLFDCRNYAHPGRIKG